jgi:hypothetical protein
VAVENVRELTRKACIMQRDGTVNVRCFAHAIGIDARLDAYPTPRLVERAIEPEGRFVFEAFMISGTAYLSALSGQPRGTDEAFGTPRMDSLGGTRRGDGDARSRVLALVVGNVALQSIVTPRRTARDAGIPAFV